MRGCVSIIALSLGVLSCTTPNTPQVEEAGEFILTVDPVSLGVILPGAHFEVTGASLISDATYQARVDLNLTGALTSVELEVIEASAGSLTLRWPLEQALMIPEGFTSGSLLLEVSAGVLSGAKRVEWSAELRHQLAPTLSALSGLLSPQTASSLNGSGLLNPGEGESLLTLSGALIYADGAQVPLDVTTTLYAHRASATGGLSGEMTTGVDGVIEGSLGSTTQLITQRESRWWSPSPLDFGIRGARFEGSALITNRGAAGLVMSAQVPVSFEYSEPFLSLVSPSAVSRGQRLSITGGGFIDLIANTKIGITSLTLSGTLTPHLPQFPPIDYVDEPLEVRRISGSELITSFSPSFNDACESRDLGGMAGELRGVITASVYWGEDEVVTPPLPISLEITPSRQVVYLSFLPAFTDSLRLFGLRNLSSEVIEEIIRIVRRDYEGVNLEVTTTPPSDFERYSIVEIGGPDPNARELFGLDNTTGLDHCNQRLDDALAGRNSESGGIYGGVFVESFLNLSPTRNPEGALADPLFDEIFNPVMNQPAQRADLSGGRAGEVTRAIQALGHLVGHTLTHEIGHSLGLPVIAGCGAYHNIPGPRQIMDCGQDRPFLERVGLDPEGPPRWTEENFLYLQQILPL